MVPGDSRGWVEYREGWKLPNAARELEAMAYMKENAKLLNARQRVLIEKQVRETCDHRQWLCHAVNCRSNHMHIVVTAVDTAPKKVRADLKAWCSRRLSHDALPMKTERWWADRGSIRWVFDERGLNKVMFYTNEGQEKDRWC